MTDYDFLIVGSGFGGSVSALRLAEKGYRVAILEEGRRWNAEDFPKTNWNLRRYLWAPIFRCFGIQAITWLKGVLVLHGKGVGGGSLVYANTLMKPADEVFRSGAWPEGVDWAGELAPHYERARRMLGVVVNPDLETAERELRKLGETLGVPETFHATEVGVFFGEPGKTVSDPYFGGEGPDRTGCTGCGGCMVGCRHGAKNTLDKNYLYFAEKLGAKIFAETRAVKILPRNDGGFLVATERTRAWRRSAGPAFRAKNVVLAAGVLGTVKLLFSNRDELRTLPRVSKRLGREVRTNGECLLGATSLSEEKDYSRGIAIGAAIHPDAQTKIEAVKYPSGSSAMRLLAVPLTPDGSRITRPLKMLRGFFAQFPSVLRLALTRDWARRTIILLTMQSTDTKMNLSLKKGRLAGRSEGSRVPSYIPVAQRAAAELARSMGGVPQNVVSEVLLATPATAHVLGGCRMGSGPEDGVVDDRHEVFGHRGLYVCDGSVIPGNLGVNPSLTIAALAERFASRFPAQTI